MSASRAFLAVVVVGWCIVLAAADAGFSPAWSDPSLSVRQRADAVNRAFTNGTPVSVVVAALGTNYGLCGSSARLWVGQGPEPPNTFWLEYRFGEDEVTIGTTAVFGRDLDILSSKFTGAGYSLPSGRSAETANRIWMGRATGRLPDWAKEPGAKTNRIRVGQPDGAANRGQPVGSETNRTSAAAGPGG